MKEMLFLFSLPILALCLDNVGDVPGLFSF